MKARFFKSTLIKAALYGIMIAFAAHIGGAIPFPYHRAVAALPASLQTFLFFAAGFLIYFLCVTAKYLWVDRPRREDGGNA